MRHIDLFAGYVSRILTSLSTIFLLLIAFATSLDVGSRFLTGHPIPGTLEYTEILLVALIFLGMAYAQRTGTHVGVTLLVDRMGITWRRYLIAFGLLVMASVVLWLTIMAAIEAERSIATGEYRWGLLRVPMWPARVALFLGLAMLLLETILSIHRVVRDQKGHWHM